MRKISFVLVFIFVLFAFSICFADVPEVNRELKVYDYADLLLDSEESELKDLVKDYVADTNIGMAIVTINQNPQGTAMVYADDFVDKNNFGIGDKYDAILYLIDMDTREIYISTGGDAILYYDDERIDKILDDCFDGVASANYFSSCKAFIDDAKYYYEQGIPSSNEGYVITPDQKYVHEDELNQPSFWEFINPTADHHWGILAIISTVFAALFTNAVRRNQKTVKQATNAANYVCNVDWQVKEDHLVSQNTTSRYIPPANTGSGSSRSGGFSGGSSTHHSSSGRIHGGGGRHF
ncbi:MAG: TPM domain-containing protein [Clostridia bacterium]|nr:TPM domain-containing protein [Clostridia bacterium]